jgi:hypothetical protein
MIASLLLPVVTVTIPGARRAFGDDELPDWNWLLILLLALTPVTIVELTKLARARFVTPRPEHYRQVAM